MKEDQETTPTRRSTRSSKKRFDLTELVETSEEEKKEKKATKKKTPSPSKKTSKKRKKQAEDDYVPSDTAENDEEEDIVLDDEDLVEVVYEPEREDDVVEVPKKKKRESKPKTPKKTPKKSKTSTTASEVEEISAESSAEPTTTPSKAKTAKTPKTPKTPKTTKKDSSKNTPKKKPTSKNKRVLTHFISEDVLNIDPISVCAFHSSSIQSHSSFIPPSSSKTLLLNTQPEKERKNYSETTTTERTYASFDVNLHESLVLDTKRSSQSRAVVNVAALNIGAPIWAIDWAPQPSDTDQFAAIAPHTNYPSFHKTKSTTFRKDLHTSHGTSPISDADHCSKIQIWNFGTLGETGKIGKTPSIEFYIEQDHGFVWDLKWMPKSYKERVRLGILACACSDGCILLFSVPHPSQIQTLQSDSNGKMVIKLEPEIYEQKLHDSDEQPANKLCYTMSWSPNLKYLLSGYHDGTIALWKVNRDQPYKPLLEFYISTFAHNHPTNDLSIRSLTWFDPCMNENIFASSSNDGLFKIWDIRDLFYPSYSAISANRFWSTGVVFPERSNALITVSHDGTIRQFDALENAFQLSSNTDGPIWNISMSSSRSAITVCTSTGRVEVMSLEQDSMLKKRRTVDTRVDDLLLQVELCAPGEVDTSNITLIRSLCKTVPTCFSLPYHIPISTPKDTQDMTKLPTKTKDYNIVPEDRVAIYRNLFHPSKEENLRNWCLISGYQGIVFLVPIPEEFD